MNLKRKELIEWCWCNLEFTNAPENWEDTYIIDIINGYSGMARKAENSKLISYSDIRFMFQEDDEEEEEEI